MNVIPSRRIQVFGEELQTPEGITVLASNDGYLRRHGLRSHWFAELPDALPATAFATILARLPILPQSDRRTAFYVQVYVEGAHSESPRITQENARGYSVFSRQPNGVLSQYFRRTTGSPGYEHVKKVDSLGGSTISSMETTLLHFASFDRVPAESGIYSFRKDLTEQEVHSLKRLARRPIRANLDDAVCGDGDLNRGVIFLQNDDVPDATCGQPCTGPGGIGMYCAYEPWSGTRYCKLATETCGGDKLALILANQAPSGRMPAAAVALQARLRLFRTLRDTFLRQSPVGLKYVGYYRLLSKYARWDARTVAKYASALPNIYKAVDALFYGRGPEIVVTPALHSKAMSIIDSLSDIRNRHVRSMLADVRQDLAAARGLTRAALVEYMNSPIRKGDEHS